MGKGERRWAAFTPAEIRAFKLHGLVMAALAAGMCAVAPQGAGRWAGVLLAAALVPVPPLVIYALRRRKAER